MEEESAEDLGDREDNVPVRDGPAYMTEKPLTELDHSFLMTGGGRNSAAYKSRLIKNSDHRSGTQGE